MNNWTDVKGYLLLEIEINCPDYFLAKDFDPFLYSTCQKIIMLFFSNCGSKSLPFFNGHKIFLVYLPRFREEEGSKSLTLDIMIHL